MKYLKFISLPLFIIFALFAEATVYVLPNTSREPFLSTIMKAQVSIDMTVYALDDPIIITALENAARAGKKVRIIYEPDQFKHALKGIDLGSQQRLAQMQAAGIELKPFNKTKYKQQHAKMIIVDGMEALITSANLDKESFDGILAAQIKPARDFVVSTHDAGIISEMQNMFNADWTNTDYKPSNPQLVWGPEDQRIKFTTLIAGAKETLDIYQQDFTDPEILAATLAAIKKGVKVRLLMMPYPFNKTKDFNIPNQMEIQKARGAVYLMTDLYMHAKVVMVDYGTPVAQAYVGSCNFYQPSIDGNRELGILVRKDSDLKVLHDTFEMDWKKAKDFVPPASLS
jgi:phosphatidylserine/phosphatidylglycerophosphate/cardiolipin synthase-like enzyme